MVDGVASGSESSDISGIDEYIPDQCLSQDLDFFQKKELLKFFRELFAKERSYPSTAKILRMYIKCAYYMHEHIAII